MFLCNFLVIHPHSTTIKKTAYIFVDGLANGMGFQTLRRGLSAESRLLPLQSALG